jgi:hypothetical protein
MKNNSSPIAFLPWQKEKQQLPYSSPLEGRSRGVTKFFSRVEIERGEKQNCQKNNTLSPNLTAVEVGEKQRVNIFSL